VTLLNKRIADLSTSFACYQYFLGAHIQFKTPALFWLTSRKCMLKIYIIMGGFRPGRNPAVYTTRHQGTSYHTIFQGD
jgi:hypothetical protein